MHFLDDLKWRGLIHQTTDSSEGMKALYSHFNKGPVKAYCGFDPTSDSLHIGSLLPILNLVRLQKAGHKPIAVVGGATGMIGDPSGKTQERTLLDSAALEKNLAGIRNQLGRFLDFSGSSGATLVNNFDWFKSISYIDFLRDVGKSFSVNMMLGKESVRARLEDRDHGISYTEFSYMLLQAYDFYVLFKNHDCTLQLGGSDQWGNIVAGIDLIRRNTSKESFGITWPLVTKSDGAKFGKSEKGNVWLDSARTSPYEFYQFLLQVDDKDVVHFLKIFTFLSEKEILELAECVKKSPEKREAQKMLAQELTRYVHGAEELLGAEKASQALFSEDLSQMDLKTLLTTMADAPQTKLPLSRFDTGIAALDLLVESGLCASKGAARKDIQGGGIYLNNARLSDVNLVV